MIMSKREFHVTSTITVTYYIYLNERLCDKYAVKAKRNKGVAGMTPVTASRVQAMAGIFHPFVSLLSLQRICNNDR